MLYVYTRTLEGSEPHGGLGEHQRRTAAVGQSLESKGQDDEEDKGEQDGESGHGRASQREWGKWHGGGGR